MATLDSLAGDQRAVLQLVLARRRGYEEIAAMLSLAPAAVRARALDALEALGPPTDLQAADRQLICDYLLSQLPDAEQEEARGLLERSPAARGWTVALTAVLEPVAVDPLPRIPPAVVQDGEPPAEPPPSSRRGGIVVIALALAVILAAVVVLLLTRPSHGSSGRSGLAADTRPAGPARSSTTSSTTSSGSVKYLAQINLRPVAAGSRAVGIAEILQQQGVREIAIIGQHIPANTRHDSYEVWLYSSPTHFEKLGFVSPAVGRTGTFSDARALPSNTGSYRELIVTTETARKPTHPGSVLLRGMITGVS